jgi:D-lactate dehydrogenase (cytochrome)
MRTGLSPAALELMDSPTVHVINQYKKLSYEERPTLFIEFHGSSSTGLKEELEVVREICTENRCLRFESGIGREERNRLWEARYSALEAMKACNTAFSWILLDVAVPISKYPVLVERAQTVLEKRGLRGYAFGHAGSGNLHLEILWNAANESGYWNAHEAGEEIVGFALDCNGTATGEHGVGIGKRKFMKREHGDSLNLMKKIKELLDPNGIMNPGKIFD